MCAVSKHTGTHGFHKAHSQGNLTFNRVGSFHSCFKHTSDTKSLVITVTNWLLEIDSTFLSWLIWEMVNFSNSWNKDKGQKSQNAVNFVIIYVVWVIKDVQLSLYQMNNQGEEERKIFFYLEVVFLMTSKDKKKLERKNWNKMTKKLCQIKISAPTQHDYISTLLIDMLKPTSAPNKGQKNLKWNEMINQLLCAITA